MVSEEMRQKWRAEREERASTLKRAKAAATAAISDGVAVPEWVAARIKNSFEEEDWWSGSVEEGFWIGEHQIPRVVDGINTLYFDSCLTREREEELIAGARPTEEERIVHRHRFLNDVFTNPQDHENKLTSWHVFEVRGGGRSCYLLVASTTRGQAGISIDVLEFFADVEAAVNWLRPDGVIDVDFLRWRPATAHG